MTRSLSPILLTALAATSALALAACKDERARPQADLGAPPIGPLAAEPAPLEPPVALAQPSQEAYRLPARAYAARRHFGAAPPSGAFAYRDQQPWYWEDAENDLMVAEPVGNDWRYNYYERDAAYPYFVQDAGYGYAYGQDGRVVAVFDAAGRLLGRSADSPLYERGRADRARAYELNQAWRQGARTPVREADWRERAPRLAEHDRWFAQAAAQPAWRAVAERDRPPAPHDNGRHLGEYKQAARLESRPPSPHGHGRGPEPARRDDRPPPQVRSVAASAPAHGRDAAWAGPGPQADQGRGGKPGARGKPEKHEGGGPGQGKGHRQDHGEGRGQGHGHGHD
jgi:PAS domain-containing protein